jgi:hypothetical protein
MIPLERARAIAERWVHDWNCHDLDAIASHYADDLDFTSPLVIDRLGRADGTIRSKAELKSYFAAGLTPGSNLKFEFSSTSSPACRAWRCSTATTAAGRCAKQCRCVPMGRLKGCRTLSLARLRTTPNLARNLRDQIKKLRLAKYRSTASVPSGNLGPPMSDGPGTDSCAAQIDGVAPFHHPRS